MADYDLSQLKVLVIDKHPEMRHLVRDVLHELGVRRVWLSGTPLEAFDAFKEIRPDLILADWAPGLDGLKFLAMVRRGMESPNIFAPVLMVTAFTELHHIVRARDAGINEYLAKPFTAAMLYKRIKAIIENPRPYVRNPTYVGPDRRRRRIEWRGDERRRQAGCRGAAAPRGDGRIRPAAAEAGHIVTGQ